MKKIIKILLVLTIFFTSSQTFAANVSLTIRNGDTFILPTSTFPIVPGDTVLTVLNAADQADSTWNISNLQHYSFGDYVKCITSPSGEACDNWQYTVNNSYPSASVNQYILSDRDTVYLYFGPQNKIILSSNNINTNNTLSVTSQKYDYNDNQWVTRTGVTVGLTQNNPNDSWSPIEIKTNGVDGNGQVVFSAVSAGSYNVGIKEDGYFPTEALTVTNPPTSRGGGGGALAAIISSSAIPTLSPVPTPVIKKEFDIRKAFDFIISQQKEDGSFGEDLYTDWTTIALTRTTDFQSQKDKLKKYLSEIKISNYQLTDYERHAMALMALGINPYDISGENYIKKITDNFDGKQFGDINKDNDDIFALIVLQNAGYTKDEDIIKNAITLILSKQKEDGSWDESVDMTGAAMESLSAFSPTPGVGESLVKAREFLKQNQKDDGGFGNISSTTWAIEGILASSEKPEDWIKNDNTSLNYLAENQDIDGGTKNDDKKSKLWETAYAVTALSGKTWNQIMQKFEKPDESKGQSLKNSPRTVLENSKVLKPKTIKKTIPQNKIISKTTKTLDQTESTVIRPASISTLSALLRFFISVLDKIL